MPSDPKEVTRILAHLDYLAQRWQDESEYEPWAEYVDDFKNTVEGNGGVFQALTLSPKGFVGRFRLGATDYVARVLKDKIDVYKEAVS